MVLTHRPLATSQIFKVKSSEPDASHCPVASNATVRIREVWPLKVIDNLVGNGFKSFGDGSFGIKDSGSISSYRVCYYPEYQKIPFA